MLSFLYREKMHNDRTVSKIVNIYIYIYIYIRVIIDDF